MVGNPFEKNTHHGVRVSNEISERVQEALVLHHLGVDVMKFSHANGRRLPHIWVLIFQALPQWLTEVLGDLIHPDAAHCADGQSTDKGVGVLTVLEANKTELIIFVALRTAEYENGHFLVCGNSVL